MAIETGLIDKINILARKKKDGTITKEELEEQAVLRKRYLEEFRGNMKSVIENVDIVSELTLSSSKYTRDELHLKLNDLESIVEIEKIENDYKIIYKDRFITKEEIIELLDETITE